MNYLNSVDFLVLVIYFAILIGIGFYLKNKASQSIEDYFIGGRSLPWWALGISGMASFLDITGTMMIVSFIYMLGIRGLYIEFRGGVILVLPFMLLWTGKWHRRSQCMTFAEWMIFRFGDGIGGRLAQFLGAVAGLATTIGMITYLVKGVGIFFSMFLPFDPFVCAAILIVIATVYTMVSGFYGVVFTDVFQSAIILVGVFYISVTAFAKVTGCPDFATLVFQVTGNSKWVNTMPNLVTTMPQGYEMYRHLVLFSFFYFLKNVFLGFGSGHDPKYFGARNDRECGLLSLVWTWMLMFRWPLIISFAVLGIFLVNNLFPDQSVLVQCSEQIKQFNPEVNKAQWASLLSDIVNNPENHPGQLISGLENLLGSSWTDKIKLLSFEGTVNPERILPAVLMFSVSPGFRGLIMVALIAACMSTFDSSVNAAAGLFLRDIYQKYFRPNAKTKELIYISWATVAAIVLISFLFAYTVKSINDIWGWLVMGLGGGMLTPLVLRLYWWRFNGIGFATGTGVGMVAAIVQRMLWPGMNEIAQFLILGTVGLLGAIAGTYLSKPTSPEVLMNFYTKTRPFGFWGYLKKAVPEGMRKSMQTEHKNDLCAVPFSLLTHVTILLIPMQLVIQTYKTMVYTIGLMLIGLAGMYYFWYRNLPRENYDEIIENSIVSNIESK